MEPLFLGIDAGHTITKAVLFDKDGRQIAIGRGTNVQVSPEPSWQERDMNEAKRAAWDAIRSAISGINPARIVAIGVCGHGDGLYLLDKNQKPLRNAILATDNRAPDIAERLSLDHGDDLLRLMGQHIYSASPAALLIWLRKHEPKNFAQIGSVMNCKDWIRFTLTGVVGAEVADASGSFVDMTTHQWSDEILRLTGLTELKPALPPLAYAHEVVGTLSQEVAFELGLIPGTQVVAGTHDVHAAAIGVGAFETGVASIIFGTWSINQVFSDKPIPDYRWHTRASVVPNRWLHMCTSPSSASNANWFWNVMGISTSEELETHLAAADSTFMQSDRALYFPYLFGGPAGTTPGAQLQGLRGWHSREHLLASIIEGIIFNHKHHLDILRSRVWISSRLIATGGSLQSRVWAQAIADIFDQEIQISDAQESGARGVAALAGFGSGYFSSIEDIVSKTTRIEKILLPNPERVKFFRERYDRYREGATKIIGV